ncbi:MAG: hypothetical protein N2Z62_16490 [Rhodobacteraceae bacterium]|nr:hypothetical protein [Paracoccaceae bacterium]
MSLIADILLIAGTAAAGFYCLVLSRRLRQFTDLETGVGGAVAVLSAQVDDMTRALERARSAAGVSAESLEATTARAETVTRRLEILLAAMHDLPEAGDAAEGAAGPEPEPAAPRAARTVWRRPRAPAAAAPGGVATPTFRRAARAEDDG